MREIKFRAWIPEAKMLRDGPMFYQENQYLSSFIRRIYDQYVVNHPSYLGFQLEERLQQYTGLKDRNDKEIYESDIFIDSKGDFYKVIYCNRHASFLGECIKETFQSSDPEYQEVGETTMLYTNIEVIGNIHENPELLEVK
jgi:uncharacterized phage protein (TIGR01671 family)